MNRHRLDLRITRNSLIKSWNYFPQENKITKTFIKNLLSLLEPNLKQKFQIPDFKKKNLKIKSQSF